MTTLFEEVFEKAGSKPVPTEMTDEESALRSKLAASDKELERALEENKKLRSRCKHRVNFDTDGGMYTFRTCYICGKSMGML
jgi:hypothetical protein